MTLISHAQYGTAFAAILLSFAGIFGCPDSAKTLAQIVPDDTLGTESSVVNRLTEAFERIDGGAIRGDNLFHSFLEFNITEGAAAYFANPQGIINILSRVTGDNPSHLLGTLGVLGNANLFFLNPNGIIFGPNAQLDITGSFVASTANGFILPDGTLYSATHPQAPPLLTVTAQAPIGLHFEGIGGTIVNQGRLVAGKDFTLAGGNLHLQGQLLAGGDLTLKALDTVTIRDSITIPFIAAARGDLLVQGNQGVDIYALNHPVSGLFSRGDMVLRSVNPVIGDAHFWSGGNFRIEALDGNLGDLASIDDPIIRSQGDVDFSGYFGASLHILAGGSVNIDIAIITGSDTISDTINPIATPELANVVLSDGTSIVINGNEKPTLDIRAGMNPEAIGSPLGTSGLNFVNDFFFAFFNDFIIIVPPPQNNPIATSADITIGGVFINAPNGVVLLTNQYQPNLSLQQGDIRVIGSLGNILGGDSSNVILDSKGKIEVASTFIGAPLDVNNGANVTLLADENIFIDRHSGIVANGQLSGNITLKSRENITIAGLIQSTSQTSTIPPEDLRGGNINISARALSITDGAQIIVGTFGRVNAGDIKITTSESVTIDGENLNLSSNNSSGILSLVQPRAVANAGNIEITTGSLTIIRGAQISSSSFGTGNAGNILIDAKDSIIVDGERRDGFESGIVSQVEASSIGNGGIIKLTTDVLKVTNGGQASTTNFGTGNAGNIFVQAANNIFLWLF